MSSSRTSARRREKNRLKGNYSGFVGRYEKACWHCGGETFGEQCAYIEEGVVVHAACLLMINPEAKIFDRAGARILL